MDGTPISRELLLLAERCAAARALPPVRALHLPPAFGRESKDGEFCALELADGSIGLSYVLLEGTLPSLLSARPGESIAGASAIEVARWHLRADPAARAVGLAAINAISQWLFREAGWTPARAQDSIGGIDPRPGDHIGMVGLFPGLAGQIVGRGASLVVVELDPALAGERDGYRVTLDRGELAACDKVLSTTTLLLNDTLDAILGACRAARTIALIGPGGGCLPDPLFERGVTQLGGTAIDDRDGFVDAIASGGGWNRFASKYLIARDAYPGAGALLARLR